MYSKADNDGTKIFVFGSNYAGIHGKGAAADAHRDWNAEWGVGEGLTGQSYALPTKSKHITMLAIHRINANIKKFIQFAKNNPDKTFLVTAVACGLAGWSPKTIGPLFADAPENCILPPGWRQGQYMTRYQHVVSDEHARAEAGFKTK